MTLSIDSKPRTTRHGSHSNVVTSVAFSTDGRLLASGSWDGTIKLWDVSEKKLKLKRALRGAWDEVDAIAFTPDGTAIAGMGTGWDEEAFGAVNLWDLNGGRGRTLIRVDGKLDAIAFSPDGSTLATGSGDSLSVRLWDADTGRERGRLSDHTGPIWSVNFSPNGSLLAATSGVVPGVAARTGETHVGEIRLWDLTGGQPRLWTTLVGHEYGIITAVFAPDGQTMASGGFDREVKLWDLATGRERLSLQGHEGWVATVAFTPGGEMLATGSHDHTIKLWDVATGANLTTLKGHSGNVYAVAISPDGSLLASGSLDGTVRLWHLT